MQIHTQAIIEPTTSSIFMTDHFLQFRHSSRLVTYEYPLVGAFFHANVFITLMVIEERRFHQNRHESRF